MGVVYEAEDLKLRRHVALKFLPAEFENDAAARERFQREAFAASALNHPNICTIHEIDEADGRPFIAMELLEGQTLRQRIGCIGLSGRKNLDPETILDLSIQILSALEAAHRKGIVHRDIKPANLFVTEHGQAKVLDFGLAKQNGDRAPVADPAGATLKADDLTASGATVGTVAYMSPEQVAGKPLDARTDLFSFGAVVYEMATGRQAFGGDTSGVTFNAILEKNPPLASRLNPSIPLRLDEIIAKALEKDRDVRYQHASDFSADLKRLRRDASSGSVALVAAPAAIPWWRKKPVLSAASAVALVIVAGGLLAKRYFLPAPTNTIRSIVVLPFTGASGASDASFLENGISMGVTDALSQLPGLRVMASNAGMRYAGKNPDPEQVGKDLNVDAVLEGNIEQEGGMVSIDAEVVKTADDTQLWGQQYTEKMANVAMLQQNIAHDISDELRVKLTPAEKQQMSQAPTENADAYRLYLLGRHEIDQFTPEHFFKAADDFQQAVDEDPSYAAASAGLGETEVLIGYYEPSKQKATFAKAQAMASGALSLDNRSAEAHLTIALIDWLHWDFGAAQREFRRALVLNPNFQYAHGGYSSYLATIGHFSEALEEARRGLELDPLYLFGNSELGGIYADQHECDQAIAQEQKTLEIDPNYAIANGTLSSCYAAEGKYDKAVAALESQFTADGESNSAEKIKRVYAVGGIKAVYRWIISQEDDLAEPAYNPVDVAAKYALLGDKGNAFVWLNKAFQQRASQLVGLKSNIYWDNLRSDPRYAALVKSIGFPQ